MRNAPEIRGVLVYGMHNAGSTSFFIYMNQRLVGEPSHGEANPRLLEMLRAFPTHWHMQPTVWIVESEHSATHIRDELMRCLHGRDKLFVGRLPDAA